MAYVLWTHHEFYAKKLMSKVTANTRVIEVTCSTLDRSVQNHC